MLKSKELDILFFDSDCLFCNFWVQFIFEKDKKKLLYFAPLQGKTAKRLLSGQSYKQLNTLYFYQKGKIYTKSIAVFKICDFLGGYFSFLKLFKVLPVCFLNNIYDLIAKNRYKIVMKKTCDLENRQAMAHRLLV